jgi:hypothetical protein
VLFVARPDGPSVLHFEDQMSIGSAMLVVNPRMVGEWSGLSVFGTWDPLWPIQQPLEQPPVLLPLDLAEHTCSQAFNIQVASVQVEEVRMVATCGQGFCDGRYGVACVCTRHSAPSLTVPVVVLTADGVESAEYGSVALGRLMFTPEQLLTSCTEHSISDMELVAHDGFRL